MAWLFFCHSCKLCDDELEAGNVKGSRNFEKCKCTSRHTAFNDPTTKVGKWSRNNIERTERRNENDSSVRKLMPCARAGVKPHLDKLNENTNLLEVKNDVFRKTNKIMLDNNATIKMKMIHL